MSMRPCTSGFGPLRPVRLSSARLISVRYARRSNEPCCTKRGYLTTAATREWLELLTEEAIYWIPLDRLDDPATMWSLVFDDRRRIEDRVAWLGTGKVHGQTPPSRIQRSVANIEAWQIDDATCRARCTFACSEYRPHRQRQWNGTTEYLLERRPAVSEDDPGWSIAWKLVVLLDASGPQENLTVLL